ncbi:hypothetical protein SENE111051_08805 [Serratia nematodiphila]|uniref:Uncharacterized protein n=1 Tax=Serratia nematodiphila TaxID=458197 RepID=A0A1G5IPW0_9GAMM|nr:hypothetical protein JL05_07505 [Serratia nematodiphila DZ0503SBS1]SCY77619.1 hypothetical protein SAMN02927935_02358 [Serratia nematodiphila]HAU98332.1 hypothetical protein [Serratia marcescens]
MYTVIKHRRERVQAVDEVVVLERIELIARLGVCYESQAKDKDIALIWISELAGEMRTNITPDSTSMIKKLAAIS